MKSAFYAAILSILIVPAISQASTIIYQHDFSGSASSSLIGVALDSTNSYAGGTSGATWSGNDVRFRADGTTTGTDNTSAAYVPFSPVAGYVYTISITVDATSIGNIDSRFSMSLLAYSGAGSPSGGVGFTNGGQYLTYATIGRRPVDYANAPNNYDFLTWTGSGANGGSHRDYAYTGPWTLSIVLDTTGATQWSFQLIGSNATSTFPLSPTGSIPLGTDINYIMFNNHREITVAMSDFSVVAVPEASAMAAFSMLSLLSLGIRRRKI